MGYLLNPNTGKEVTWWDEVKAMGGGFATYTTFMLSCEEYTRAVMRTQQIDQTPPFRISLRVVGVVLIILIAIYYLIKLFINPLKSKK